jgi:hypothetical protein
MPRATVTAGFLVGGVLLVALVLLFGIFVLRQDRLLYFPTRLSSTGSSSTGSGLSKCEFYGVSLKV